MSGSYPMQVAIPKTFKIRALGLIPSKLDIPRSTMLVICLMAALLFSWVSIQLNNTLTPSQAGLTTPSRSLHHYSLSKPPAVLGNITDNASGLTYNKDTDTLFAVINNPEQLVELDKAGHTLRTIPLKGFEDTEGIAYVGNNQFVILEKRRCNIVLVDLSGNPSVLHRQHQRSLSLPQAAGLENHGFEGITVDIAHDRLFVVSEKKPIQIWQIDGFINNALSLSIQQPQALNTNTYGNEDLSGVFFDNHYKNLLLLSDDSKQLTEVSLDGASGSRLSFKGHDSGLAEAMSQPEGVTMDNDGTLYVLSEPNLLYQFSAK